MSRHSLTTTNANTHHCRWKSSKHHCSSHYCTSTISITWLICRSLSIIVDVPVWWPTVLQVLALALVLVLIDTELTSHLFVSFVVRADDSRALMCSFRSSVHHIFTSVHHIFNSVKLPVIRISGHHHCCCWIWCRAPVATPYILLSSEDVWCITDRIKDLKLTDKIPNQKNEKLNVYIKYISV